MRAVQAQTVTTTNNLNNFIITMILVLTGIIMGITVATGDVGIGTAVAFVPVLFGIIALIINNPYYGLLFNFHYSFFFIGLNRYITNIPLGLVVDAILFITSLSVIFQLYKYDVKKLNKGVFYTTLAWFIYTAFELFNPNAPKVQSWFYATRGVTLYAIQIVPLTLLLFNKKENLDYFIRSLLIWGIASSLWGLKQINLFIDPFEQRWLDQGGAVTHVLFGQLRAFSFYSDAGQYGVTMAYIAVVALILSLGNYSTKTRLWYAFIFVICLIGMGTSGSRGPTFAIFFGGVVYLILQRNTRILLIGLLVGGLAFGLLKFTYIGNTNYQIYRIRSSLDTKDASLLVRLENQKKMRDYLSTRPFGAGMGTTDVWAQRFYPNSVLANIPTDSWFVKIWAETGVVGIIVFAFSLSYVVVYGSYFIRKLKDNDARQKLLALYAGFAGIVSASFGNPVFGQQPLGTLMYMSMAMICVAYFYDITENNNLPQKLT
ncbi:MAG: O-antigen ligase family protein [Bacteroidia bacterium]